MELLKTQLGRLRVIAFVEGVSFLVLLFITMPLKYYYAMPQPNKVFGMVHGVLFMFYVIAVVQAKIEYNWSFKKAGLAFLAAIIPFGTFWADVRLFRDEQRA